MRINFKVEWISYNIDSDSVPMDASVSTSQDLQNRIKDFTENLDIEVNAEKLKDTVFKKMNEEVIEGSGVILETSIVEGVISETSVGDADQWPFKEMLAGKAENNGGKIVKEASVEEAGTANFKVNSHHEGCADGKSTEEILLLVTELGRTCFDGKSYAETEQGCFDGNYDKGATKGQKSLSADIYRSHDGNSSETSNGQLVSGLSPARSRTEDSFEVKYEVEKLSEEANKAVCTGNKESLLEGSSVEAEIENAENIMSLPKAEANDFEADAETFIPNIMSGYKVSCDAAERDNVEENLLRQSGVESEAGALEGESDAAVMQCDTGMGDTDGRSVEEISLGKQVIDDATGKTGFERKEGEMNCVFELCSLMNERKNLDSEIVQIQSEEGFYETDDSELPVHLMEDLEQNVSMDNLTSASLAKTEAGSGCLSAGYMSCNNQSLKHMCKSSERDAILQESLQMSEGKCESCQEDMVMQRCQEEPLLHKSVPRELDNIRNETDLQMSFQMKSNTTGSHDNGGLHGLESNVCSLLDSDGRDLTEGFDKLNLSGKENKKK